jgi:hypothetical protein
LRYTVSYLGITFAEPDKCIRGQITIIPVIRVKVPPLLRLVHQMDHRVQIHHLRRVLGQPPPVYRLTLQRQLKRFPFFEFLQAGFTMRFVSLVVALLMIAHKFQNVLRVPFRIRQTPFD